MFKPIWTNKDYMEQSGKKYFHVNQRMSFTISEFLIWTEISPIYFQIQIIPSLVFSTVLHHQFV